MSLEERAISLNWNLVECSRLAGLGYLAGDLVQSLEMSLYHRKSCTQVTYMHRGSGDPRR